MNAEEKKVWMKEFADLIIKFGVNLQHSQNLVFILPHEAREFGLRVVESAYEAGSGHVTGTYVEHDFSKMMQKKAPMETLKRKNNVIEQALGRLIDDGAAILFLYGAHPEAMYADTSEQRKAAFFQSYMQAITEVHSRRRAISTNSCISLYPTPEYSSYLFPEAEPSEAQLRLMEILTPILKLDKCDPVKEWQEHRRKLISRANLLKGYSFDSLHLHGGETDLKVRLVREHIWTSAFGTAKNGVDCAFSLPSEELFTSPDWHRAEGRINSTRKTYKDGYAVDEVVLYFHEGRIITAETEGDYELLLKMLDEDEQSRYLGEVAIVSEDNTIANQPMSFKNLLFDENAGCHIAFGTCYPHTIRNGAAITKEELLNAGMNVSKQHIDLIIWSNQLSIDGVTHDGSKFNIMRNGLWSGEFN